MAEIVNPELRIKRFISNAPAAGVLAAVDGGGVVQNLIAWDTVTGDVTHYAPAGTGANSRHHIFYPLESTGNVGNFGIGITSPGAALHIRRASGTTSAGIIVEHWHDNAATPPTFSFRRARAGGTLNPGTVSAVQTNVLLGQIDWTGYDGAGFQVGVRFYVAATENWTGAARGAGLVVQTTQTGTTALTGRWAFQHTGHITPLADGSYDLGATATRIRTGYFATSVVIGTDPGGTNALRVGGNVNISDDLRAKNIGINGNASNNVGIFIQGNQDAAGIQNYGIYIVSTLTATGNSQTQAGVRILPTFVPGAFTGLVHYGLFVGNVTGGANNFAILTGSGIVQFGDHLRFSTDNAHDIGSSGANRPRNLYLSGLATLGGGLFATDTITLSVPTATRGIISLRSANVQRWQIAKNETVEGGANAGSNLVIHAYDDAGVNIDTPLSIVRSALGQFAINRPLALESVIPAGTYYLRIIGTAGAFARDLAIIGQSGHSNGLTVQFDGAKMLYGFSGPASIATFAGNIDSDGNAWRFGANTSSNVNFRVNGAAGTLRDFRMQSAGIDRWIVRTGSTAEGGANSGSEFSIIARDDAGGFVDSVITIIRAAAGAVTIGGNASKRNIILGWTGAALAVGDVTGFPVLPTMAGAPTGGAMSGSVVVDTTNNRLYVRAGATWRFAALT